MSLTKSESTLILALSSDDWINISNLMSETKLSQFAVYNAINMLKFYDLITERKGNWNAREFKLTSNGMKVLDALQLIEGLTHVPDNRDLTNPK